MSLSDSLNNFALRLFENIGFGKNENFFVSPFSIATALAMCLIGAKNETADQLKQLLGFSKLDNQEILKLNEELIQSINNLNGNVTIKTANKLFPKNGFEILDEFLNTVRKNFKADVQCLDFGNPVKSAKEINLWVSNQTNDKIRDLIDPSVITELTRLILVNAIYFKGNWHLKFDSNMTIKEDFHLSDSSVRKVDMMKIKNKKFRLIGSPGGINADTCEIPYEGGDFSMTIILPHEGHSLDKIEKQLNHSVLNEVFTARGPLESVNLHVPKFKLRYNTELSSNLKKMGATLPFDERKADFTGITSHPVGLCISDVIHQAFVEVNEEGTEAAAATAVVMRLKSCAMVAMPLNPINFICNRPFLFVIQNKKNNGILFMGKYSKPE
ncbi:unnamed protein product [Brachionus calyciflorus]|uniref:Serpin domain-containing protein n=1 Tax=Brachionus calyciflorus TaxID=104777 RepID=A0A813PAN0_9BILA|nr:unnamed protein product [Brachionus calyciflorus]